MREKFPFNKETFSGILLGLALEPRSTLALLFSRRPLPHVYSLIFFLLFTTIAPIIYQFIYYGCTREAFVALVGLLFAILVVSFFFLIFESWLLVIFGVEASPRDILALFAYSSAPMVVVIILVYLYNYSSTGSLSLLGIIIGGNAGQSDQLHRILPFLIFIAQIDVLIIFCLALKSLGKLHLPSTLLICALSVIPFYGALALTLFAGEVIHPGISDSILELLKNPVGALPPAPRMF